MVGSYEACHQMKKEMAQGGLLPVFEFVQKFAHRFRVDSGGPRPVKMTRVMRARWAEKGGEIGQGTRTRKAKRRPVGDKQAPAVWAELPSFVRRGK